MIKISVILNKLARIGAKMMQICTVFGGDDEILADIFGCQDSSANLLKNNGVMDDMYSSVHSQV
jgi:hypothetical protein